MIEPLLKFVSGLVIPSWVKPAAIGAAALAVFFAGWGVNGWRLDSTVADLKVAIAKADHDFELYTKNLKAGYEDQLRTARDNAVKRETALRADADRARRAADGLRVSLSDANRHLSELSATALHDRAITLSAVLDSCVDRYTDMAASCDRHVSDKQTLIEGWPK